MKLSPKTLLMALSLLLITGCSIIGQTEEPEIGKYTMKGAETEDFAWVLLEDNHQFQFNRNFATSYIPMGSYDLKGDELVLTANEDELYRFKIKGDSLIFESGKGAESLVEKGTIFELKRNN